MTVGLLNEDLTSIINLLNNITTIIFDLGEVIVNVDTSKTTLAFSKLLQMDSSTLYSFHQQSTLFTDLEKGLISESSFRDQLRAASKQAHITDKEIDNAWNAMIGDTPQDKLNKLSALKEQYTILALSNTNSIHIRYINEYIKARNGSTDSLEDYFHHAYYSHHLNARKPDAEIYTKVAQLSQLQLSHCLFIDDRIENIITAEGLGMKTFHMQDPQQFYQIFSS